MAELITFLTLSLFWFCSIFLAFRLREKDQARKAAEHFRNFQAFAVLKFHSGAREELRHLSIEDLRRDYNVTAMYNEIGR